MLTRFTRHLVVKAKEKVELRELSPEQMRISASTLLRQEMLMVSCNRKSIRRLRLPWGL